MRKSCCPRTNYACIAQSSAVDQPIGINIRLLCTVSASQEQHPLFQWPRTHYGTLAHISVRKNTPVFNRQIAQRFQVREVTVRRYRGKLDNDEAMSPEKSRTSEISLKAREKDGWRPFVRETKADLSWVRIRNGYWNEPCQRFAAFSRRWRRPAAARLHRSWQQSKTSRATESRVRRHLLHWREDFHTCDFCQLDFPHTAKLCKSGSSISSGRIVFGRNKNEL